MFKTGDIVLVHTADAIFGNVVVPGIIRYEEDGHYEVNVIMNDGKTPMDQDDCHWWGLREHEMTKIGEVFIGIPVKKEMGIKTFTVFRLGTE